ncbi:helix-hairpin-helix domain-containing protein [Bacillus sp. CECT 9360]|uniref:helix-hairpin-helix domain-containing protein n=1 Tax=Bacillus sp. CECT 9360 TaxID=2845821 RepID=UPI001E43F0CD|nr:helix-hairpin-helix domain-containing protein [Bacillus sp. CECT 9360]CAH0347076.1 hypothetical protein BCI9360_03449 [Bacillus sp. CECT 9360]
MKIVQKKKLGMISLIIIACCAGYFFYQQSLETSKNEADSFFQEEKQPTFAAEEEGPQAPAETKTPTVVKVDVKGAVKSPGVFTAKSGERVIDLVAKAGNFTENADKNKVNLAQLVEDQMVIYVPEVGEDAVSSGVPAEGNAVGSQGAEGDKINLNTAAEADLDTLPGIGPAKATAIIEYREKSGPFQAIEDLKNISGIGDKTFEKLQDSITVK